MFLKDKPQNWIMGGLVFIIIGSFVESNIIILQALLYGVAIAGWVCLVMGIVKLFKRRR